MTDLMKTILALTVSGTALAGGLALLRRLLKNKLPQWLIYYLWLLVLLRLIVPVAVPLPEAWRPHQTEAVSVPVQQVTVEPGLSGAIQQAQNQLPPGTADQQWEIVVPSVTMPSTTPTQLPSSDPWHEQLWDILCDHFLIIWLGGAVIHFLWFAISYLRFCRRLKETYTPLWEHEQALLDMLRNAQKVTACRSILASTPMLVGLVHPRIILPPEEITTRQLECILRHELTHLRRRDLLYKWFAVAATSIHWFNPFMPWLRQEISRCCELSCDEKVVSRMDERQKQWYGETLLALASLRALPRAVPATTLCEEKQQLRERLLGIMKYKKATALILLLSCLLTVLIAGCAAVLGPQNPVEVERITGPLTEEQQAPVLENIRLWAAENIEVDGELTVTYSEPNDRPQSMGWATMYANGCWLYDLHTGEIKAVEDTYPDTAQLGMMLAQGQEAGKNRLWAFYLTNGEPKDAADPIQGLRQLAADYPDGKVGSLSWWRQEGKGIYMSMDFTSGDKGYTCEYSSVCGVLDVLPNDQALARMAPLPLDGVPDLLDNIIRWQAEQDTPHNGQNYSLDLAVNSRLVEILAGNHSQVAVHNLSTGEMTRLEGEYTGCLDYGCITVLGPAQSPFWLYLIDDAVKPFVPQQSGQVAVLTQNAALENAFVQTVDADGRTVVMDMAVTLSKGDLVYVESQDGTTCKVTVLAGEPPRVQGQLDASLLTADRGSLLLANQVILKNAPRWGGPGEILFVGRSASGVANVEDRKTATETHVTATGRNQTKKYWLKVTLPGGDDAFWVDRDLIVFEWPLPEPVPDLAGKVAVVLDNTMTPYLDTTSSRGEPQKKQMELKQGTLVWVQEHNGASCDVTVLTSLRDTKVDTALLSAELSDLKKANQVILNNTSIYAAAGGENLLGSYSGVVGAGLRNGPWWKVYLESTDGVWIKEEDLVYQWPLPVSTADLAGKIFIYEEEGFGSDFTIKLHAGGTFGYYEGMLSSHIGMGTWAVEGDILTLREDTFDRTFRFRVQDGALHFLREGSDQFMYIKVADGARFLEDTYASAILRAYSEVLWNSYLYGVLPDGSKLDWWSVEEAAKNHFAITDIDGDGRTELLLSWTNASTAGHDFVIFDYRDDNLHQTDLPFTSLRFYDNGAVEVDSSHNQGWAGRFWPFGAYTYDTKADDYVEVGYTDGWDKQLQPKGFPDDIDTDGDGLVYEVREGNVTGSRYTSERMMDGPAFEEWRQSYLSGAQLVEIELIPLTEENIAALGAPKPNDPKVKPVG